MPTQRHSPDAVVLPIAGFGFGWFESECTDDGFAACYQFEVISEKASDLDMLLVMLPLITLPPLIFAEFFHLAISIHTCIGVKSMRKDEEEAPQRLDRTETDEFRNQSLRVT